MKRVLVLLYLLRLGNCGEHTVSINVKNVINSVSDKFISYEIDFYNLMILFQQNKSFDNLNLISPAYAKLTGFSTYLKNENPEKRNETENFLLFKNLK